ncbi:hypothetical protein [Helicobacter saguini]|nr:hypothetical protein [Helicobacter saguini]
MTNKTDSIESNLVDSKKDSKDSILSPNHRPFNTIDSIESSL